MKMAFQKLNSSQSRTLLCFHHTYPIKGIFLALRSPRRSTKFQIRKGQVEIIWIARKLEKMTWMNVKVWHMILIRLFLQLMVSSLHVSNNRSFLPILSNFTNARHIMAQGKKDARNQSKNPRKNVVVKPLPFQPSYMAKSQRRWDKAT